MSDILIGVIVFGLVFGAAIFGMFLGRNLRVLEQKVNATVLIKPFNLTALGINVRFHAVPGSPKQLLGEVRVLFASENALLTPS
jgi:hypothetical protein